MSNSEANESREPQGRLGNYSEQLGKLAVRKRPLFGAL
jgi:hypothetical protein